MGATTFTTQASGKSAKEAFSDARAKALHDFGHRGYTGTIAEKVTFVVIQRDKAIDAMTQAYNLIDASDARIDDKYGPAGCFDLGNGEYYFFGWAAE